MSRVSTLPPLAIELGPHVLDPVAQRALTEVRVQRRLSLPALCELVFLDPPASLERQSAEAMEGTLRATVFGGETLFEGEVTAVEHEYGASGRRVLRVRGYDLLYRLRRRQPVRAHLSIDLEQLAKELSADWGWDVQFVEPGPKWRKVIQFFQSDLELLTDLAQRCGVYLTLQGNTLYGLTLAGTGDPIPLELGSSLLEARLDANRDADCDSVEVSGWDPSRVEFRGGIAAAPRVSEAVQRPASAGGAESGVQRTLTDETVAGDRHAELLAQAELDRRTARRITLWGVAEGRPDLWPGSRVDVQGVSAKLAGVYVATAVEHRIDRRSGFVSEFSTAPPPERSRGRGAIVTWGAVSRIDDPESLGRICVALPAYNQVETDWMGVATPGAGAGKGLLSLPDVGDQVLVVFPNGNPEHGVVLGGLFGAQAPPDQAGIDQGNVRRFTLMTPGGQRVQLDDGRQAIRLENREGSYVELSSSQVRVHACVDLSLEAPGRNVFIRGRNIHFEQQ
jgi:phage baseplate assembly protein gpV